MIAGMESQDYELFMQRLAQAEENNSNIVSDKDQENNERRINEIYLKIVRYGIDTLNDGDSTFIVEMAAQCPYIGGTAVYKARALLATYMPSQLFDDIKICNNIGVYKNSNNNTGESSLLSLESDYLKSIKPNFENAILKENDLLLFPNPTANQLNIRYKYASDSKLQIVNILGTTVKEIELPAHNTHISVLVQDLFPGIYTYRQVENKNILHTGKLIITN